MDRGNENCLCWWWQPDGPTDDSRLEREEEGLTPATLSSKNNDPDMNKTSDPDEEWVYECGTYSCTFARILFTSAWIWLLLWLLILYTIDSCWPGAAFMVLFVGIIFIITTCGGCQSWFGNFPWILVIASSAIVILLALSTIERMDPEYHAHGWPYLEEYVSYSCTAGTPYHTHHHHHVYQSPETMQQSFEQSHETYSQEGVTYNQGQSTDDRNYELS